MMKKVKVYSVVSLDGFVSRADGDIDWAVRYVGKESYGYNDFIKTVDCVLINPVYYTQLTSYDFRWRFGDLPCYVLSKGSFAPMQGGNIRSIFCNDSTEYLDMIGELTGQGFKNIWVAGNQDLISALIARDAIDEITLLIMPVTLGHGTPLIGDVAKESTWQLAGFERYDTGVVKIQYAKKNEKSIQQSN